MPKPAEKRKAAWEEMMKQSIFEATVSVMKEHGPAGIRMDLVAKAADMATGTLYNYFRDKDALLFHVVDTLFKPYHESMLSILKSGRNPQEKLVGYLRQTFRSLNEQKDIIAILIKSKDLKTRPDAGRDPEFKTTVIGIIGKIIKEGIAKGVFRKCHAHEAAGMIFGAVDIFMEQKILGELPERTVEEEVESCKAFILPGILAAP